MEELKRRIREVPDFPKPGILFYDITTLLQDPEGLRLTLDAMTEACSGTAVDKVVGIESRGFLFGPTLASRLGAGFVPVRKPGKLPARTTGVSYELEYGSDRVEVHSDAIAAGEQVIVVDDLIATGGTAAATAELVEQLGGTVALFVFLVELTFLSGRERLGGRPIASVVSY